MAARGVLPGRGGGRVSGATGGKLAMRAGPEWRAGTLLRDELSSAEGGVRQLGSRVWMASRRSTGYPSHRYAPRLKSRYHWRQRLGALYALVALVAR